MGRLESARGRRDGGHRSVPTRGRASIRATSYARTALIQEVENAGGPGADAEAQRLLEELVAIQPDNPAVLVERARLAAKRGDAAVLTDSVVRLEKFAGAWPPEVAERYRALQQADRRRQHVPTRRAPSRFSATCLRESPRSARAGAR